jgi:hypothetical protein
VDVAGLKEPNEHYGLVDPSCGHISTGCSVIKCEGIEPGSVLIEEMDTFNDAFYFSEYGVLPPDGWEYTMPSPDISLL